MTTMRAHHQKLAFLVPLGHSPLTVVGQRVRLTPHIGPEREEHDSEQVSLEGLALGDLNVLPFESPLSIVVV